VLDPLEPILQSGPGPGAAILGSLGAVVGGVSTGLSTYKNAPESWKQSGGSKTGSVAKAAGVKPRSGYYGPAY